MIVGLEYLKQSSLIIPMKTGVVYEFLSGGFDCHLKSVEGYLIPIEHDSKEQYQEASFTKKLADIFPDGSPPSINKSDALKIALILQGSSLNYHVSINWEKISQSMISYLNVIVTINSGCKQEAILTWPNPD